MSKLTDFIKLMTGHFDNKEQFDKMQAEGKTYPYAKHINTACNDKIKNLPENFNGTFVVEESYYKTDGKSHTSPHLFLISENNEGHGLKKQREKGMIKISSVDDENNIFLIVEDNGVGMQPEQVVQINKEMYEDIWVNRTTGFGIANVNRRIKLYYGEEYGLILESEPDIGTKVIVVVPKTRQAEKK